MKTTSQKQLTSLRPHLALVIATAVGLSLPPISHAQVAIEGGPAKVAISDQDGKSEAPLPGASGKITSAVPTPAVPNRDGAMTIRPVPNSDVAVRVPVKDTPEPKSESRTVAAAAVVVPESRVVDPERAKAMAEYEREFSIDRSSLMAKTTFRAENLYEKDQKKVDALAEPTLERFVDYLALLDGKKIKLTYHYLVGEETALSARARTVELVEWFANFPALEDYPFTVEQPLRVKDPTPVDARAGGIETEYVSYIEVVVEL